MAKEQRQILAEYLPGATVDQVYDAIVKNGIQLRITRARNTKLGDYRPAANGKPPRISINHNLNPYEFLITFIHELAHHDTFAQYGRRHYPHGAEWKENFQKRMVAYINRKVFPADVEAALYQHLYVSNVANGSETELKRALRNHDPKPDDGSQLLETLPHGQNFMIPSGRVFQKMEQRRKRYICRCMTDNRNYLFSPLAMVIPLNSNSLH